MKTISTLLIALMIALVSCNSKKPKEDEIKMNDTKEIAASEMQKTESIYEFVVTDLSGSTFNFSDFKGSKIMIVNTASECGYTPQYEDLQALYDQYKDDDFVIVGFPANNFGQQEPGTNEEIAAFCKLNYGVTFPMMSKSSVKGEDMNEVYQYLTQKSKNGHSDSEVKWNFQKYLIDENGHLANVYYSKTLPTDPIIKKWIESK